MIWVHPEERTWLTEPEIVAINADLARWCDAKPTCCYDFFLDPVDPVEHVVARLKPLDQWAPPDSETSCR